MPVGVLHAQSSDVRAMIRASLVESGADQNIDREAFEALVDALTKEAESQGITVESFKADQATFAAFEEGALVPAEETFVLPDENNAQITFWMIVGGALILIIAASVFFVRKMSLGGGMGA